MLHLIPVPLHRWLLRLAHALRKRWWRIRQPRLRGCRVLALDGKGRVLLVRHAYGSGKWMPPGGGVGRGESPVDAAVRELREETGCSLRDAAEVLLAEELLAGAINAVHIVAGRTDDQPRVDRREVIDAAFFAPEGLPDDMPPALRAELPAWVRAAKAAHPLLHPPRAPLPATTG